jgi:hypothetical protein
MMLVTLQARLTTPCLVSICMRAGLEANYVSHHHQTLDLTGTLLTSALSLAFTGHAERLRHDTADDAVKLQAQRLAYVSSESLTLSDKLHRHAVDVRSFCS